MERLALDIETTGISPDKGNRVIELAIVERNEADYAIEVVYHQFFNPDTRDGAMAT